MLRRHLEHLGHGFKLSAIKEALDILSDTLIEIRLESHDDEPGQSKRRRFMKGTILSNYSGDFAEGDQTGEESRAAMTFHPAATAAILQLAFYPINQLRVGRLKRPLARWLTTRMSHNYRQARKKQLCPEGRVSHIPKNNFRGTWPAARGKITRQHPICSRGADGDDKEPDLIGDAAVRRRAHQCAKQETPKGR